MKNFDYYVEQTLDDVKEVKHVEGEPKDVIASYLLSKGLLNLGNPGRGEVKLLQDILKKAEIDQTFSISKAYLSGPMTKYPYANHGSFYLAEALIRNGGVNFVINPATIKHDKNNGWVDYMIDDLSDMLQHTDTLVLLPGWEKSKGAALEVAIAKRIQNIKAVIKAEWKKVKQVNEDSLLKSDLVFQQQVSTKQNKILQSSSMQRILNSIAIEAESDLEALVMPLFESKVIFMAFLKDNADFQVISLSDIIDMNEVEEKVANYIQNNSQDAIEETSFSKYFKQNKLSHYQEMDVNQVNQPITDADAEQIIIDYLGDDLAYAEDSGKSARSLEKLIAVIEDMGIKIKPLSGKGVYISGPMSGVPFANRFSFYIASALLKLYNPGFDVVDPAALVKAEQTTGQGRKISGGFGWLEFLQIDIRTMLNRTDNILLINGWGRSKGALVELIVADNIKELKQALMPSYLEATAHTPAQRGGADIPKVDSLTKPLTDNKKFQIVLDKIIKSTGMGETEQQIMKEVFEADTVIRSIMNASDNFTKTFFDDFLIGENERTLKIKIAERIKNGN